MSSSKTGIVTSSEVVGIDPSFTATGICRWDGRKAQATVVRLPVGPCRLLRAAKALEKALDGRRPELAVIEGVAYGAPSRTVVCRLSELCGVYKLTLERLGVEWLEVSPTMAKRAITGSGKAEKHVVAQELKKRYGIGFSGDKGFDMSDAAALAVWGWEQRHGQKSNPST